MPLINDRMRTTRESWSGRCPKPRRCLPMEPQPHRWRSAMNRARLVYAIALSAMVGGGLIAPQPAQAQLGSLVVTVTSPASGSTVSGTVPVSASLSIVGSLTVSRVDFYRDGNLIGSDSAAPYSVSWNTTSTNNGSHTLTAVATDVLSVQWSSNPVTVTVSNGPPPDTTPPTVPTGLTASAVSSSQINLSWTASSDNVGVSGYRVYRGGTQIATTSATSFANTGLSASTTYSYTVAAYDAAGNLSAQSSSASATTPAPPDTTPPTVSITSPVSGATVGGTTSVTASASDNVGVVGVQFLLDGANLGVEDTTAPYSVSWNTTTASNGSHTLTAVARDAAGNRTTSAAVTVTVFNDTTPPTVSITSPVSGATVGGTTRATASASDNVGVVGVQFLLDGANLVPTRPSAAFSVSWNTTTASNGSHTLTAVARDAAGNRTTSAAVTVTVFNDTTPPTVSITSPVSGATVGGTTSVTANASDDVGVVGVQFLLDGANLGAEDTATPYSMSWNTTTASNGSHTLTAVARDAAGNRTTSAPVTVTVFNDTTPPTVSITSPVSGATVGGTTSVTASASDNVGVVGVQFLLDGANLGVEDTTAPYSVSWNTTTASNGSHTLTAVARDAAGNRTTSAPLSASTSHVRSPPTVSITSPVSGATVGGTTSVTAN